MICLWIFLGQIFLFSSGVGAASKGLRCVGCVGNNALGSPSPSVPNCEKYSKTKPRPEFIITCDPAVYPNPICYAYKDGSFSGCDDKTRSPFPGTCSTVDSVDGQRKDVCFCHTNICNKGTEVGKRTALQLVLTLPLARLFY